AAWKEETKTAGLGWFFSDFSGPFGNQGKTEQHVLSPLVGEALALRVALLAAKSRGISKLIMKSDSLELINTVNSDNNIMEFYGILHEVRTFASSFSFLRFLHIPRSANVVADNLA
ncbi:hypothetical protein EUTSA_v10000609mg, partial [Eutrema salsugineum]